MSAQMSGRERGWVGRPVEIITSLMAVGVNLNHVCCYEHLLYYMRETMKMAYSIVRCTAVCFR